MPGCCGRETNELTNGAFCLRLQIQAESFPVLANTSCADLFSGFSLYQSLANCQKIQRNGDTCNALGATCRIRSTHSRPPVPRLSEPRAPSALRPTLRRALQPRQPHEPED